MKFTYYGHSCFTVELNGKHLTFDPFITGNELASKISPEDVKADYIFVSHGHFDHMLDTVRIAKNTGASVFGGFELYSYFTAQGLEKVMPINPGGKIALDFGVVKAFAAQHSSSFQDGSYAGVASGFAVKTDAGSFYYSGDTALSLDMQLVSRFAKLDFAVLPIGDLLTMGVDDAIEAAKLVQAKKVIGVHYDTFGWIKLNKEEAINQFREAGLELLLPAIGETITL